MSNRRALLPSCVGGAAIAVAAVLGLAASPPPAMGAQHLCVLLLSDAGGETLINRCRDCRQVTLSRRRPGASVPNVREMMLPPVTATPTPSAAPGGPASWATAPARPHPAVRSPGPATPVNRRPNRRSAVLRLPSG
ncbi:MAG: hypothetical protein HWD60_06760 [Defluviicoccus sp.]|nr:MAG: hypothetical protein HWD60_06760 [Defluviicoccus sp.]